MLCFFFSSRRRHTRWPRDWSSDVCSSDLQRFLLLHEMHCLSQQVNHLLESRRLRPEVALAGSQLSTIANMVAASIGVSIVPQLMVKHYATPGCVSLPFAPPVPEREL